MDNPHKEPICLLLKLSSGVLSSLFLLSLERSLNVVNDILCMPPLSF